MPLHEYQCEACGRRFEVIQKFSDPHTETCRLCGKGPVQRLFSTPAIKFKGTGWYITDYAKKGSSKGDAAGEGDKAEAKTGEKVAEKGDAKPADGASAAGGAKSEPASSSSTPAESKGSSSTSKSSSD